MSVAANKAEAGKGHRGNPSEALRKKNAKLKQDLADLRKGGTPGNETEGVHVPAGDVGVNIDALIEAKRSAAKLLGDSDAHVAALEQRIVAARRERDERKGVGIRVRDAERALAKRQKAVESAQATLETAKQAFDCTSAGLQAKRRDCAAAEAVLLDLRAQALSKARSPEAEAEIAGAKGAVEGIQRLGAILEAGASASKENRPELWKNLVGVHAELVRAAPAAYAAPVTSEPAASLTLSDGEEEMFLDEFLGAEGDDHGGGSGDGSGARYEQSRAEAKQKL